MTSRLACAAMLSIALVAHAAAPIDEYYLKAAFLCRFARFVEWPPNGAGNSAGAIALCVLGQNPFGRSLKNAVGEKANEGRDFAVRELSDVDEALSCHVLFVSSSERKRFRSILNRLETASVLTVGDSSGFAADGGVVNFKLEGERLRIEVNVEAASRKKLRISSKLLSLAVIVKQ